MVNPDVMTQRRGRKLRASVIMGVYDMRVKFNHSSENPTNYELELITVRIKIIVY